MQKLDSIKYFKNITKESITHYKKNGFVIIKNFFDRNEIIKTKKEILNQIKRKKNHFFYYEKIDKKKRLRRIEKVSDYSNFAKRIILSEKIFSDLEKLENSKFVLFKDKLNFKMPGGSGFLPHIDGHFFWDDYKNIRQNGWYKYAKNFINLVIPLEKSNKNNGCIYISNKKNTKKLGKNFDLITKKLVLNTPNIKKNDFNKFSFYPIILDIGDVCFFNWKCAHYSEKNKSKSSRMIFYSTYSKKNNLINVRKKYYKDKLLSKNNKKNKSLLFN